MNIKTGWEDIEALFEAARKVSKELDQIRIEAGKILYSVSRESEPAAPFNDKKDKISA